MWRSDGAWGRARIRLVLEEYAQKNPYEFKAHIKEIKNSGRIRKIQIFSDLHRSYFEAQEMYNFMTNVICPDIRDITIMSENHDFYRLFKKPIYKGDFLKDIVRDNNKQEAADREIRAIERSITKIPTKSETWKSFQESLKRIKYTARHDTISWKNRQVQKAIKTLQNKMYDPDTENFKVISELQ